MPDCDVCAAGKSRQQAHPKTADQHVQHPFQLVFTDLMGPFTPEALGGYKYVSKIYDEHTRWPEIYHLKSKNGALHAFQSFVQSMVIPSGVRVERLRADKRGEFIGNDFKDYCTQTGVLLEYASTNTPQQIGLSERVGGTLAAMVRCMPADSGLPMFLWGELMFTAAYVGNRAPHSALNMQSPYKMLKGTEPDLRILRVIGARAFVHIERRTKKLAPKAVEGRLVGYSSNSKSYRVYNPVTRCIESRNVIFIETPSRLLPPPSEGPQLLMQELPPGDDPDRDNKGHNYITDDDDFLRDLRNYTSVVDHPGSASTDHVTANRRSENTLVAELLGRICAITRRDLLEDGVLPGEASPTGEVPQGGVLELPEQPTSPAGGPVEAPFAGSSLLQQHGQSRHGVTPAVTQAGNVARSFRERSANDSAHLAEIATDSTLSKLRRLGLYTKVLLPDVVHQTNKTESVVEYACATTNVQRYSVGEKMEVIPNNFKEAMTLPAKAHWKAASDKEAASLKKNNVYTVVPATAVPVGHKIIGSRWVYKVKADKSYKGRVVVLGWGQVPGVDCRDTFTPVCRLQSIRMVLAIAAEFDFECWQLDYNTAFLNAKVEEEVYVKMAPGYEEFNNDGVPMVMRLLKSLYCLRQSPRCWYGTVDEHVVEIGFKSLKSDPCAYIYSEGGAIYVLALCVDDVLLLGKDRKVLERIKRKLMERFSMTDMGDVSLVLGWKLPVTARRGQLPLPRKPMSSPCWSGTGWGIAIPRIRPV